MSKSFAVIGASAFIAASASATVTGLSVESVYHAASDRTIYSIYVLSNGPNGGGMHDVMLNMIGHQVIAGNMNLVVHTDSFLNDADEPVGHWNASYTSASTAATSNKWKDSYVTITGKTGASSSTSLDASFGSGMNDPANPAIPAAAGWYTANPAVDILITGGKIKVMQIAFAGNITSFQYTGKMSVGYKLQGTTTPLYTMNLIYHIGTQFPPSDSDGDGVLNAQDQCPTVPGSPMCNGCPLNQCGSCGTAVNTDGDSLADCVDPDDDNDGYPDGSDAFPLNAAEWRDTDGDGQGNNADQDDDNDTVADASDNCPLIQNPGQADCNSDGVGDVCEVQADCDGDGLLDECEIAFGFSTDCNSDGVPDTCQGATGIILVSEASGNVGVPSGETPRSHTFTDLHYAEHAVTLTVDVRGDFNGNTEWMDLLVNTFPVGRFFETGGNDCPSTPDRATVTLTRDEFNALLGVTRQLTVTMICPATVDETECKGGGSTDFTLSYLGIDAAAGDCNGNQRLDFCDIAEGTAADCNGNHVPDSCDITSGSASDCNANGIPDSCDLGAGAPDCNSNGVIDTCESDGDGDGTIDACDGCPTDPLKTQPGQCGCGFAETDTDSDGTANCNDSDDDNDGVTDIQDAFPLDPTESSDNDSDGQGDNADPDDDNDGTPDTADGCQFDPLKTSPGQCGCGNPDTDDDGDTIANCIDNCPLPNPSQADCDSDGVGDTCEINAGSPYSGAIQWTTAEGGNGHWYYALTTPQSSQQASDAAGAIGGHLATIRSAAEDTFVRALLPATTYYWIGGTQPASACEPGCDWGWVTGEPWGYTNWDLNEPNEYQGISEDQVMVVTSGKWWDAGLNWSVAAIVEWDAETDCNANGVPDSCDISSGAGDCNSNGVIDTCEPDADGDGTIDVCDGCPTDPVKTQPGQCGCGFADTDTDADGTANCIDSDDDNDGVADGQDAFPLDSTESTDNDGDGQGDNGDPDDDNDGTPDTADGCQFDPLKTSPGQCGCGNPDTDDDGDTIANCIDNCSLPNPSQADCDQDGVGDTCELASGATDCDANGVPDSCDITGGLADCNANGLPDPCDIAAGTSLDFDGNGVPDECQTITLTAGANIQATIDGAPAGEMRIIVLGAGTYAGPIAFGGKPIVLRGAGASTTFIESTAGQTISVIRLDHEPAIAAIEGVTIRGGLYGTPSGTVPVYMLGGGIYLSDSAASVRDCVIEANRAGYGGGVYALRATSTFERCIFRNNISSADGGGFQTFDGTCKIIDCTIANNEANSRGGGMHGVRGQVELRGTIISSNTSSNLVGGLSWVPTADPSAFMTIIDCTVSGNNALVTQGGIGMTGVGASTAISLVGTTVCSNLPRPNISGSWLDLGGNTVCDCVSDINVDGITDGIDLAVVLQGWGQCSGGCEGDLSGDGIVDGNDLAALFGGWGLCPN